jgi:hypothetical protein
MISARAFCDTKLMGNRSKRIASCHSRGKPGFSFRQIKHRPQGSILQFGFETAV